MPWQGLWPAFSDAQYWDVRGAFVETCELLPSRLRPPLRQRRSLRTLRCSQAGSALSADGEAHWSARSGDTIRTDDAQARAIPGSRRSQTPPADRRTCVGDVERGRRGSARELPYAPGLSRCRIYCLLHIRPLPSLRGDTAPYLPKEATVVPSVDADGGCVGNGDWAGHELGSEMLPHEMTLWWLGRGEPARLLIGAHPAAGDRTKPYSGWHHAGSIHGMLAQLAMAGARLQRCYFRNSTNGQQRPT